VECVGCTRKTIMDTQSQLKGCMERGHLGDQGVDGKIILKQTIKMDSKDVNLTELA
jgi:hypothetical protein